MLVTVKALKYDYLSVVPSSCRMYFFTLYLSLCLVWGVLPRFFFDSSLGSNPHVNEMVIITSYCLVVLRVALVNLSKYSFTYFPSFFLHPFMAWVAPLYQRNCMKFVKKAYFNCAKLLMLPSASVLNHVPVFPSNVVGKYVHQNLSFSFKDVTVHSYVSM